MLNNNCEKIINLLEKQIYGSSTQGSISNDISDLINHDENLLDVLILVLKKHNTNECIRIISGILEGVIDSKLKNNKKVIDIVNELSRVDDFRVWCDLVRPIFLNLGQDIFNNLFVRGLHHNNIIVRSFYFEKIIKLSDSELNSLIGFFDDSLEKLYFNKLLNVDDISFEWCLENIVHPSMFIKNIVFRIAEKSSKFSFEQILSLVRYANNEDIWEAFTYYSRFSECLSTI